MFPGDWSSFWKFQTPTAPRAHLWQPDMACFMGTVDNPMILQSVACLYHACSLCCITLGLVRRRNFAH
ncbi:uncharacterized protein K460DRAFT_366230 [Cucurbitaria berberidis CBS 394.84]|uniref:Uncharacterized protein n=1 Tax=Cucurbitaria berberidis CBS 394.84 TaxID=1168544 RepID=A0A9P4GFY5_9PLEO|nr:uncharacterized protein K460DRAFT_366230 [Cucurbitaria berberidis CBS 394.84]KAF1845353.1 hypothetical protein K460DRAFT_366230 [Cucurbitaria berberidis CBS 394.84]